MKRTILYLAVLFVIGCHNQSLIDLPIDNPQLVNSIDILSDSTYFSEITSMKCYDSRVYACCMSRSQILCLDNDLRLINTIGNKGKSESELMDPSSIDINNDKIVVFNYGKFKYYDIDGEFIKSESVEQYIPNKNFVVHDGIYYSSNGTKFPMVAMMNNNYIGFGERYEFPTKIETNIKNSRFTLIEDNNIITISDNLSYIEVYNKETLELKDRIDYSNIKIVDKIVKKNSSEKLSINQYRPIVSCCDIYNSKLYILLSDKIKKLNTNKILVFDVRQNYKPIKIIQLPGERYMSFCINNTTLYAYNTKLGSIEKFKI